MNKRTVEIQISTVVDEVATSAARHAFVDACRAGDTKEQAIVFAREAALLIAKDFNVRGEFNADELAFRSTADSRLS